ncbi:MAG: diguanylate cyclase [Firmicutes bacterium]|jgi:diguanylate cyclase (GGDEF)-like protein|nr:diguanylate cyclase [Bacillota bacterium]
MKNKLRYIIIGTITLIVVIFVGLFIYNTLNDKNKITVNEKKWINANLSTLQNTYVINNSSIFADNGYGVFYDFMSDFSKEYSVKINPITYNYGENNYDDGFKITNTIDDNSVVFYTDYYVLVSKNYESVTDASKIKDYSIGVAQNDYNYIKSYVDAELVAFNSYKDLEAAFEGSAEDGTKIDYMLVPRFLYLDFVVSKEYKFIYHFSDVKAYYVYQMKNDDTFSSIIKKYFNNWKKSKLAKSYNNHYLSSLTNSLNLSEKDVTNIKSKVYQCGFVNNSPYELLTSGTYGGIVSEYLQNFSNLTGVEFKFTKYKDFSTFANAINSANVDIYFNYYNLSNNYKTIDTNMNINYVVVAKDTNDLVVNSLNSLQYKDVYVLENSMLYDLISKIPNVNINKYKDANELSKIVKNNGVVILDNETYNFLKQSSLKNYSVRYYGSSSSTYSFKLNTDDPFYNLFRAYVMLQDKQSIKIEGLYNHDKLVARGRVFMSVARYILLMLASLVVILYILFKHRKRTKVKISKKIKKEDKIKYIDQLTSLKNRNYLNDNIDAWNKNRVYPQATIIIDLNKVQEINDTKGYEEGDRQIKAASNILIRTQLDNSDIMRTDGNEFLIYTIGYEKRSIESYIRKLIKEFKDLPYDYNAIITYSMIEDDVKTIEDSINDAVLEMKEKKQEI